MMMLVTFVSYVGTFLGGVLTGACSGYWAARFTDQRRRRESLRAEMGRFEEILKAMPDLLAEIRNDLVQHPHYREFFVADKGFNAGPNTQLVYWRHDHRDLGGKVTILENHRYVEDVTQGNTPKYRMTEEFVALLTN